LKSYVAALYIVLNDFNSIYALLHNMFDLENGVLLQIT
jgi:hypothetical protein